MAAGSPRKAHETAAARWSKVRRATPSPAGTGANCGLRRRHAGPLTACTKQALKSYTLLEDTRFKALKSS